MLRGLKRDLLALGKKIALSPVQGIKPAARPASAELAGGLRPGGAGVRHWSRQTRSIRRITHPKLLL
jgi:hypothetical protein